MEPNINQLKLSLFARLNSYASVQRPFTEVLRLIEHDNDVRHLTDSYRKMQYALSKKKADESVKSQKMPAFSVGVRFDGNGRKDANILAFTGLALCDLDHLTDVEGAVAVLTADPHVLLLYRTLSGSGLRVIYRYRLKSEPQSHPDATSWPAAFLRGNSFFAKLVGAPFDGQCGDYGRLSGLAHDDRLYFNPDALPFVITDDEIVNANLNPEKQSGRPRTVMPTNSQKHTVEEAWPHVEHALEAKQLTFGPGRHHSYVVHAAFLFNRYGVPLDDLMEWADSHWAEYPEHQRVSTLRSCYRHDTDHGTWKLPRRKDGNGNGRCATLTEVSEWFEQNYVLTYNDVTDETIIRTKDGSKEAMADDREVRALLKRITKELGMRVAKADIENIIGSDQARLVHPVRDYINALPPWDGMDRVAELAGHIKAEPACWGQTAGEAQQTLLWMLHKWLVAMTAGWLSEQHLNHTIFVLIGPQGIYKTTFWRFLLPEPLRNYFWENAHNSFTSKDDQIALTENCLVEIEEIDMSNPRVLSEVKALATAQTIKVRRPYQVHTTVRHRMASICASGNQQYFLADDTGNRRWLCHLVSHVDDPRRWQLDYDQLYAQLRDELRNGFQYWFTPEEQELVEKQNEGFRIEGEEEQLIRMRFRKPKKGDPWKLMNSAAIAQMLTSYGRVSSSFSSRKIGMAMKKFGFEHVHTEHGNFFRVFIVDDKELQARLLMEVDKQPDSQILTQELDLPF